MADVIAQRIADVIRAHAAMCAAATPWIDGTTFAPLIELEHLGHQLAALRHATDVALKEARLAHRAIRAEREEAA